jgi:hypothetical protein
MAIKKLLYIIIHRERIEFGAVFSQGFAELDNDCKKILPVTDYIALFMICMSLSHLINRSWINSFKLSPNLYQILPQIWKAFILEQ